MEKLSTAPFIDLQFTDQLLGCRFRLGCAVVWRYEVMYLSRSGTAPNDDLARTVIWCLWRPAAYLRACCRRRATAQPSKVAAKINPAEMGKPSRSGRGPLLIRLTGSEGANMTADAVSCAVGFWSE